MVDPQPYLEFNYLVKNAKAVITDSGGVTEEATVMGVPCMTLRDSTERPETVTVGTNQLIGTDPSGIRTCLEQLCSRKVAKRRTFLRNGMVKRAERIVLILEKLLCN